MLPCRSLLVHRGHNDNASGQVTAEQKALYKKLKGFFLDPVGGREGKGLSLLLSARGTQVLFIGVVPVLWVVGLELLEHHRAGVVWLSFPAEDANPHSSLSAGEDSSSLSERLQGFQRGFSGKSPCSVPGFVSWTLCEAHEGLAWLGLHRCSLPGLGGV